MRDAAPFPAVTIRRQRDASAEIKRQSLTWFWIKWSILGK